MANRWGNSGWLYFGGSKITVDGDCNHEIKRRLRSEERRVGKEYFKAVYCHHAYLIYMQSISWEMIGLEEAQAGIKIAGRHINNLRYADDTTLWQKAKN